MKSKARAKVTQPKPNRKKSTKKGKCTATPPVEPLPIEAGSPSDGARPNWIARNPLLYQKFSPKQKKFLTEYAKHCSIRMTVEKTKITAASHYYWMEHSSNYKAAYSSVKDMVADTLEDAAFERAVHGVDEPVFYKDEKIADVKKFSDTLTIFLLKGNKPEKYNKDRHEHSGPNGGPIPLSIESFDALLDGVD